MNVVFLNPHYPPEMPDFTRGLAEVGARVIGVGDAPPHGLPSKVQGALADYVQVPSILAEDEVIARVRQAVRGRTIDRVESVWEPTVILAARLREALGAPGMSLDTVLGFRDKQIMKDRIAAAGLRVPRAARIRTVSEARKAAEIIGFPLILKPIAGAGSADTYRCDGAAELDAALARMGHVEVASVEEFVDGDEYTYDTICAGGRPLYENVAQYLPRPLVARTVHDINPVIVTHRDLGRPELHDGIALGRGVLRALGMGSGFTHMEWYRKSDGEVVFGEIGCRPGGARLVDQMNLTSDVDLFREWARAVVHGRVDGPIERLYSCAIVFFRARGQGTIRRIEGVDAFVARHRQWVMAEHLLPVGSPRRNWKNTLLSDGFLLIRHPDHDTAVRLAHEAAESITLYAG